MPCSARLLRCSQACAEAGRTDFDLAGKTERWLIESMLGAHGTAIDEGVMRGLLAALGGCRELPP